MGLLIPERQYKIEEGEKRDTWVGFSKYFPAVQEFCLALALCFDYFDVLELSSEVISS